MQTIEGFQVRNAEASRQFEQMYTASKDPMIQAAGRETFEAVAMLQAIQTTAVHAGRRRRISARAIRPEPAADRPVDQERRGRGNGVRRYRRLGPSRQRTRPAPSEGVLANLLREYGQSLSAFWNDMGDRMNDVVVVTMSEFGRTAGRTAIAVRITATPTACSSWAAA